MQRWLFLILLGAAGAYAVRRFAVEGIYLASDSMAPTLPVGRHIFVNKMAYDFSPPRRGDVIMFDSPIDPSRGLVKRVIGIPGDRIQIKKKHVFLNGMELEEPYVQHTRPDELLQGDDEPEIVVPKDELFVMGDNRDVSGDSRDWKDAEGHWAPFLPMDKVRGLVERP